jgi:hypothetical protein
MAFKKKSQLELQFNWIFVLIVGIVFLAFFFMLISSQTKSNEIKISASLTKHFRTIIDSTSQKSGTLNEYKFPSSFEIDFECDIDKNIYEYRLNDYKVGDIKYDVIFSPRKLFGQNIYTWTREWELPESEGFSVSTFLYVTNKRNGYIFINSTSSAFKTLFSQFPENISVDISDGTQDFGERNYDNYTYILFKDNVYDVQINDANKIKKTFIVIEPLNPNDVFEYGNIYYCDSKAEFNNQFPPSSSSTKSTITRGCEQTQYLGSASLYGAIFSSDKKYYDCMMTKAIRKLRLVTLLQYYRIENFNATIGTTSDNDLLLCKANLGIGTTVEGPYTKLKTLCYDDDALLTNNFNTLVLDDKIDDINTIIKSLQSKNRVLALDTNCIKLY